MGTFERKRVDDVGWRPGAVRGPGALPLGLVFLAVGGLVLAVATGLLAVPARDLHAPRWVIGALGACFAGVGALAAVVGVRARAALRARAVIRERYPDQPWRSDHDWDETGIDDDNLQVGLAGLGKLAFVALFLAPFHWVGFFHRQPMTPFAVASVLFDLLLLYAFVHTGLTLARALRFGRTRLRFEQFPFRLGGALRARLCLRTDARSFDAVTLRLRLLEEVVQARRGQSGQQIVEVVLWQLYEDRREVAGTELAADYEVPVEFTLPADGLATDLSGEPRRWWQLDVACRRPGLDLTARFPLPVAATGTAAPVPAPPEPVLA